MKKKTKITSSIYNLIVESKKALSHQEIKSMLTTNCNRVTIYRALDRLVENKEVHKIIDSEGLTRYANSINECGENKHHHGHIHFSCDICKEVICLEETNPIFELPKGYTTNHLNFTVQGVCKKCNEQE